VLFVADKLVAETKPLFCEVRNITGHQMPWVRLMICLTNNARMCPINDKGYDMEGGCRGRWKLLELADIHRCICTGAASSYPQSWTEQVETNAVCLRIS